ncbi:MAG: zinc transport system substrate-binding protein [Thermoplasmata archaeon]|jgi:zinc transport system substrate-binding protein|nr:zinc transport system substrate-binding protein [Thermoplasmata archaeon]
MRWVAPLSCLVLLLAGCASTTPENTVAAANYPVQYLAERIAGDLVPVRILTPPGVDLHEFEPTLREIQILRESRVLVLHGLGVEPWVDHALESLGSAAPPVIRAATLPAGESFLELEEDGEVGRDPHTWLDPLAYIAEAKVVRDGLMEAFPEHAAAFAERAAVLVADLEALHAAMAAGLAQCEIRTVVTNHDAYSYFARRYGLEIVSLHGLEPGSQPDPQSVRDVIETIRATDTTVLFVEDETDPAAVASIVAETHIATGVLHVAESRHPTLDYLALQRENLAALSAALRCSA